ncbi:MAG: chitobiase/beta-hexosaminidase C-terminal domain-containing protein [Acidobacteriaceae bacterium]|jgi:hypothetical protein
MRSGLVAINGVAERFFVGWVGLLAVSMGMVLGGCGGGSGSGGGSNGVTPTVATPAFWVAAGTYTSIQSVPIASATPGATIYYTTNGSTPTTASTLYTGPVSVSVSETLEAIAVESGYNPSAVASAAYVINIPVAATPTFSVAAGTYTSIQTVTITTTTQGAGIYYTTNGTTPTTSSTVYSGPVTVAASETLEAIAGGDWYANSAVASATYVLDLTVATPAFSVPAGTYTPVQVPITDATPGATIYYTTNGSTPTTASTLYSGPVSVAASETLEAIAVESGYINNSAVASAAYVIKLPVTTTPTFSAGPGASTAAQSVTIADITPGATIYYTTNGTTPTTASAVYSSPINVTGLETLEAMAVASGYSNSAVARVTFEVTVPGLTGSVSSGSVPIAGAHVYLFTANATGYGGMGLTAGSGNASVSLLSPAETGASDSIGAYVTTNSSGGFSLTGDFSCTTGQQLYVYALGGTNAAAGMMAAIGNCPSGSGSTVVMVDEVSTVAAAYAFAGFATDATHVGSSGTALALTGIADAFANAGNLASLGTGLVLETIPAGTGTVPWAEINTLANILASCVQSAGPSSAACTTLFSNAMSGGSTGTQPTDTATAAINIAHNPGTNVATLYGLASGTTPYLGWLGVQPHDWTMALTLTGGGSALSVNLAIDASGNAWVGNQGYTNVPNVTKFSSSGALLSPANGGYYGNAIFNPSGISIDDSGNAWIASGDVTELTNSGSPLSGSYPYGTFGGFVSDNFYNCGTGAVANDAAGNAWVTVVGLDCTSVTKFSSTGSVLSGVFGFVTPDLYQPDAIAIDGSGNAWIANSDHFNITKMSSSGAALSGTNGFVGPSLYPGGIAIDRSGNVWAPRTPGIGTTYTLEEFSNSGSLLGSYTGGGLNFPAAVAIDGAGDVWIANDPQDNYVVGTVSEFSNSGAPITGSGGYDVGPFPVSIAIDGSGDVWVTNGNGPSGDVGYNEITSELIGAAVPVITPISAGLPATPTVDGTSKLGTRP